MSTPPPPTELSVPYVKPGETYVASILLPLVGVVLVLLRLLARLIQKTSIGLDDWFILPALALVVGMGVTLSIGVHGKAIGYSTPYDKSISPEDQITAVNPIISLMGKVQYAFILLSVPALGFLKLSIAFFYRRLFVTSRKTVFDWATKVAIAIVIAWTLSLFFGFMLSCGTHISASWGSVEDEKDYCGAATDLDNALVVSGLLTDVMIFVLPLPVIWNLHMTTRRKLIIIGILATGSISIVASIIKVVVSYQITNAGLNTNVDPDLTVSTILYWSMIEAGLAVIAACLPTLQYLVRKPSLDRMISSVRSAFSLPSIASSQRSASRPRGPYVNMESESEVPSVTTVVGKGRSGDDLAMGRVERSESGKGKGMGKTDGILVSSKLEQRDDMV